MVAKELTYQAQGAKELTYQASGNFVQPMAQSRKKVFENRDITPTFICEDFVEKFTFSFIFSSFNKHGHSKSETAAPSMNDLSVYTGSLLHFTIPLSKEF